MIRRCHSKDDNNYKDYGGRGITVCDRWKDIKTFVSDMSSSHKNGLTLDRIDNDGNYCKENCRWATPKQQTRNKRVNVVYKGECAVDAAKRLGGCKSLVIMRIWRSKWSLEKAFNTPIQNI